MESKIYLKYTYIHHQSYHSLIRILLDEVCATCVMIGPKRGLNVMIIQKRKKKKNVQGMVEEVARVEGRKYEGRVPLVERILSGL